MVIFENFSEVHRIGVIDIFNYYVTNTTFAYRSETLSYSQFDMFLENAEKLCGYAVIGDEGRIIGLCQLKPFREISTFDKTVELTYFLDPKFTGRGIGSLILAKLTNDARDRGKKILLASLSGENSISYNFHKKNGFEECGRFQNIGDKFGRSFDIVYMQKILNSSERSV